MRPLILCVLFLGAAAGCVEFRPVGPMAKYMTKPNPNVQGSVPAGPIIVPAPKPVEPAELITPDEVSADTADAAVQKMTREISTDRDTISTAKTTALPKSKE